MRHSSIIATWTFLFSYKIATMMLRQNDTTNIMMTFYVLKSSCVDGEATSSSFEVPPACNRSAIKCGIMHISETHPILHFIPQTHQTSFCKLHFPREKSHNHLLAPLAPAPQRSTKVNVITQESEKYQKVWILLQKSSASAKQMWGTNMPFYFRRQVPQLAGGEDCGKQNVSSDHGPPSGAQWTGRWALGLESTRLKQKSSLLLLLRCPVTESCY